MNLLPLVHSFTFLLAPAQTGPGEEPVDVARGETAPRAVADEVPEFADPIVQALTPVPGGLTSDDVSRRAVESSPTLASKQAELEKAAAAVDEVGLTFLPRVTATAGYSRLSPVDFRFGTGALVGAMNEGPLLVGPCPPGVAATECVVDSQGQPVGAQAFDLETPLNQFSLAAALSVPLSDYVLRLVSARKASQAGMRAAKRAQEAERLKVQTDAKTTYYNWLRAVAQVAVAEQSLEQIHARLADARRSYEVGMLPEVDVLRLEALAASSEAIIVRARAFRAVAERALSETMGEKPTRHEIGEDVLGPADTLPGTSSLPQLIEEAHTRRLELLALREGADAVEQGIKAARAAYYPRLDAMADVMYANPNPRFFPPDEVWNTSWSVGAMLTWVITETAVTRSRIKQQKAERRGITAQMAALRRGITMEVTSAWHDREQARAVLALNEKALTAAEAAYRVAVELYQAGEATTTDIIEAESERVNARLHDINARIDLRVANAKLLHATGRLQPLGETK